MLDPRYEVAIVGGGIIGCAIASALCNEGMHVALVTSGLVGDGATAAGMGHLVVLDDNPAEAALCNLSVKLWEKWRDTSDAEFSRCGTLWLATNDEEVAALELKRQRLSMLGIASEALDRAETVALEPLLGDSLVPLQRSLRVKNDAVVYAPRVCATMCSLARAHGLTVIEETGVNSIGLQQLQLSDGRIVRADHIVVAAGVATSILLPELRFVARKGHLVITDRAPRTLHHQVVEMGYGKSAHDGGDSIAFNIQPRPTGQLLIGSSRQTGIDSNKIDDTIVTAMLRRALNFMPGLCAVRAIRTWTGVRPGTPDNQPYIGRMPARQNTWVAAGHEGIGITQALGTAQLITEMILGKAPTIDCAPHDPARVFTVSGAFS